jgi:hypothetical protein
MADLVVVARKTITALLRQAALARLGRALMAQRRLVAVVAAQGRQLLQ